MIDFKLVQIGNVRSGRKDVCLYPEEQDLKIDKELALEQYLEMEVSEIVVDEEYTDCLDAIDGTEILDIKPYISYLDTPENPKNPKWVIDLFDYIAKEERRFL